MVWHPSTKGTINTPVIYSGYGIHLLKQQLEDDVQYILQSVPTWESHWLERPWISTIASDQRQQSIVSPTKKKKGELTRQQSTLTPKSEKSMHHQLTDGPQS